MGFFGQQGQPGQPGQPGQANPFNAYGSRLFHTHNGSVVRLIIFFFCIIIIRLFEAMMPEGQVGDYVFGEEAFNNIIARLANQEM